MSILLALAFLIAFWVIFLRQLLELKRQFLGLARKLGWERADFSLFLLGMEGSWCGKAVMLQRDRRGNSVSVTIDIAAPSSVVVRRPSLLFFDVGGPPVIEVPFLSAYKVRASSPEFAMAFLADAALRQALDAAPAVNELHLHWRIEVTARVREPYFDSGEREEASRQAWTVGKAAAERLLTFV